MDQQLEFLRGLMAIESVCGDEAPGAPFGPGPKEALEYTLDKCRQLGFRTKNVDGYAGYAAYGPDGEHFAILAHLDVVPGGEGWEACPAFEPAIRGGRIYGRGAIDNKGPAAAAIFALKSIADEGIELKRGVRLIFGCDEETQWRDMKYYKTVEPEPAMLITPDSHFPIINAEKSLMQLGLIADFDDSGDIISFHGGERVNVVPNKAVCRVRAEESAVLAAIGGEEGFCVSAEDGAVTVTAEGVAAHGSQPERGVNAIARLARVLCRLDLKGAAADFLRTVTPLIGTDRDGSGLGIKMECPVTGPLTMNWGMLHTTDTGIEAYIDLRFPIAETAEGIVAAVEKLTGSCGIYTKVFESKKGHFVSPDSELIEALSEVYEQSFGRRAELLSCGGATYARTFSNAVAFGPLHPEDENKEHMPDESIAIADLEKLTDVLRRTILRICG